jgi:hypothetical protein
MDESEIYEQQAHDARMAERAFAQFGRDSLDMLKEYISGGSCDLDVDLLADLAVKCGLMQRVPYDPEMHNVFDRCEPGEMIYYFTAPDSKQKPPE